MTAFMQMPKACVSCEHYQHLGKDYDTHCPFPAHSALGGQPEQTPYGRCQYHRVEVFGTQICNQHTADPLIECVDVTNRPQPRVAIQEAMAI